MIKLCSDVLIVCHFIMVYDNLELTRDRLIKPFSYAVLNPHGQYV